MPLPALLGSATRAQGGLHFALLAFAVMLPSFLYKFPFYELKKNFNLGIPIRRNTLCQGPNALFPRHQKPKLRSTLLQCVCFSPFLIHLLPKSTIFPIKEHSYLIRLVSRTLARVLVPGAALSGGWLLSVRGILLLLLRTTVAGTTRTGAVSRATVTRTAIALRSGRRLAPPLTSGRALRRAAAISRAAAIATLLGRRALAVARVVLAGVGRRLVVSARRPRCGLTVVVSIRWRRSARRWCRGVRHVVLAGVSVASLDRAQVTSLDLGPERASNLAVAGVRLVQSTATRVHVTLA